METTVDKVQFDGIYAESATVLSNEGSFLVHNPIKNVRIFHKGNALVHLPHCYNGSTKEGARTHTRL